ncbi:hypothetical protein QCE81_05365 [Caballeronia sp. LZ002]|uniref:hypothetical protein n=1 Tax=Caballeronia sp. LZ002 TaxID=3038558 RepID=UPI0028679C24|nr:hypothetical protein [Caballeronia sp. LZ002]MDR5771228.1 hypothetical protein [Caballeronia sp. LZ002]
MPRKAMTIEQRAAKKAAKAEALKAKREALKCEAQAEIHFLASQIPPHIAQGGVNTVRCWKEALDAATSAAQRPRISVDRLRCSLNELRRHVELVDAQP